MDDIFYFVDLPGYGYSKMSKKQEKAVMASRKLVEKEFENSADMAFYRYFETIRLADSSQKRGQ